MMQVHTRSWSMTVARALVLWHMGTSCVAAQTPAETLDRLSAALPAGTRVIVRDESGGRTTGRVAGVGPSGLTLAGSDRFSNGRTFDRASIATITRTDSRRNGLIIGFLVGAAPMAALAPGINSYCYNETPHHCPGLVLTLGSVLGGVGALIGGSIDGAINRDVVYDSRLLRSQARLHLSPLLAPKGAGLAVSARF